VRAAIVIVLVALVSLPAGACGGESAEEEVRSAWEAAAGAAAAGDATTFCDLVSTEGRETISSRVGLGCEDAIRLLASQLEAGEKAAIEAAEITAVDLDGDVATVRYESSAALAKLGFSGRTSMARVDDRWLLQGE
jgi:hypothetical protein